MRLSVDKVHGAATESGGLFETRVSMGLLGSPLLPESRFVICIVEGECAEFCTDIILARDKRSGAWEDSDVVSLGIGLDKDGVPE